MFTTAHSDRRSSRLLGKRLQRHGVAAVTDQPLNAEIAAHSVDSRPAFVEQSKSMVRSFVFAVVFIAAFSNAQPARAQSALTLPESVATSGDDSSAQPTPAPAAETPRHTGVRAMFKGLGEDFKHLPSKENLYWAAAGGAAALAVHPLDDKVSRQVRGNTTADTIFTPGRYIGAFPTVFSVSAGVYAFGRMTDRPKVSHLGMDLLRAIAVSSALTQTVKYSTRRLRPDGTTRNSFPSGHASDTFAVATALERHLGWKYSIPGYLFASYVAASRLPARRHWLSDVVMGGAVGVISGRTVGSHERNNPPSSITPVSVPGGMALIYSRTW